MTPCQTKMLEFVKEFITDKGYAPSLQQIAQGLNYKSLATVHKHLENLQWAGKIKREKNKSHGITVLEEDKTNRFVVLTRDRMWDKQMHCHWVRTD